MKIEIAQLWCRALRSGEFVQGKGFLDKADTFCVMGLLVNLAMISGVCDVVKTKKGWAYDNELGRVPVSVKEWADLYGQNGEIKGDFITLSGYNDIYNYTFTELADIIESNVDLL